MTKPNLIRGTTHSAVAFIALLTSSILIRWSSIIYPSSLNWDEDTFLLVGSKMVRGELPYTSTFDNKPPLATLFHAIPFAVGLDQPQTLRIMAALLVAIAAFLLVASTATREPWWRLWLLGMPFIVLYSWLPSGMSWMTQLNVIVLFSCAFYCLAGRIQRRSSCPTVIFGLLVGALPWFRTNWTIVAIVLTAAGYYFSEGRKQRLYFIIGLVTPSLIVALLYAVLADLQILWRGLVELPIALSTNRGLDIQVSEGMPLLLVATTSLCVGSLLIRRKWGHKTGFALDLWIIAMAVGLGVAQAFQSPDFNHHTLQMVPFITLGTVRLVDATRLLPESAKTVQHFFVLGLIIFPVIGAAIALTDLRNAARLQEQWDAQTRLTDAIHDLKPSPADTVWALSDHFVYWRLGLPPIDPLVAHPSSIGKPPFVAAYKGSEQGVPRDAIAEIMALDPKFIIASEQDGYWYLDRASIRLVKGLLASRYSEVAGTDGKLWVRR